MKAYYLLLFYGCLFVPAITHTKRHSHQNKIERFERRAQEAATSNTPLASALSKKTKVMSFDEARLARDYYRGKQEDAMVIKCGERILAVGGDQEIMRLTRLELAKLSLKKNNYEEAQKHAQDYLMYYPGTKENKQASLIALNATYKSQSSSHRDQTKTLATIDMGQAFLEKYPNDKELHPQVQQMLTTSYLKLIRSELNIITTHIHTFTNTKNKGYYESAQKRLEYLKKNYLPYAPTAQKRVDQIEKTLLQAAPDKEKTEAPQQQEVTLAAKKPWHKRTWSAAKDFVFEDNDAFFA